MAVKKDWKLNWYDAIAADKRVDPAAFKVAYCMRRTITRRTTAIKVEDKVLSRITGISMSGVKRARKTFARCGWITEMVQPNAYSFMQGNYQADQRYSAKHSKKDPTAAHC